MRDLSKRINVGPEINIGPGKFGKKNKCIALKYPYPIEDIPKFNKRGAFNKTVGPGKKSQINKRRANVYSGL